MGFKAQFSEGSVPGWLTSSPTFPAARMGTGMQIRTHMTYLANGF